MSFLWPPMLLLLLLIPLCVAWYRRRRAAQQRRIAQYGDLGMVRAAAGQQIGRRRHLPPILFLAGLSLLLLGMARPQATVSLPQLEGTVIITFDVSGSMSAGDVAPSRIEAAKAVAREFVLRQPPTVQIGVVAFSDGGLAVQAPTNDKDALVAAIDRVSPQRGTSLGQGILAALNTIAVASGQSANPRADEVAGPTPATIVLLSDGENTAPPDPLAAAAVAAERGVRIDAIGVGTPQGAVITVEGFSISSRLDEALLQQIAQLTGGAYVRADGRQDLTAVGEQIDLQLTVQPQTIEITSLFAVIGMLVLLMGGMFSLIWFGRVP
jgi:Ca-activated chloride channel family protein